MKVKRTRIQNQMASKGKKSTAPAQPLPIVADPEMAERFERELAWCCDQLEGIMRSSSSSKEKEPRKIFIFQAKTQGNRFSSARSALQTLNNPKVSLVRKRQMMQQLFGDYRKKMQSEEEARRKRSWGRELESCSSSFALLFRSQSDSGEGERGNSIGLAFCSPKKFDREER